MFPKCEKLEEQLYYGLARLKRMTFTAINNNLLSGSANYRYLILSPIVT